MSGTIPPIPPPFGASSGNLDSLNVNRVDTMPVTTDPINTTNTTNVSQSVVDENLPQLLDSRGGSHVTNVPAFDKEDFTNKRLKSIIISCLPNDVMKSVIKCKTAKEMWNDLILAHEGPSDIRDTKIAALRLKFNAFKSLEGEKVNGTFTRLKCLLNDLENNGVTIPQAEVNATFVNSLPRKWLSMNQTQRANNSIKNDSLATLYGKYNYEEGLIDQIYESETQRFTIQASSSKALISNHQFQDSDSDVEEDQRTNNEFMADLNVEYHERALLANQKRFYKRTVLTKRIDDMTKGKSKKGKKEKEKSEKEDEPSDGKADARSSQWVDITMKKVHRLLSMTDGDERKHALDYTYVDLHYVEDQRKNLVSKFNLLKQEISLHKSELSNLKNIVSINCSLQNKVIRVNLENESLKDEIIDLKKVIEKWTCSKVTIDQLLSEQVPGNIVKALGRKGRRKEKISSKEVVFTKADESSYVLAPEITSDSESECDSQEPLPPLPKLIGAAPSHTSESLISLSDLTLNMVDLTLDTPDPKKTRPSVKVSHAYVIKKKTEKSPADPKPCSDKKADSSTEQLLLTLMEEVKGLKRQIEIPSGTPPSSSQPSSSKATKQKTWFGPCKHCGFKNHLSDDCYSKPKCSTCGSTDHLTKEHLEHAAVKKTLSKLKAQSPLKPSPKKAPMIPKPFKECKYCGFNDHHSDHCEFYPGCEDYLKRSVWYLDSGCSRHMTGIKQYLHRYSKESGPKVVFGDDSSGDTEGYGLVNCNGITFTRVAYVNGLKHNLISISQLCDANYKVLFTKTQGTIYNQNDEVVLIAPRRRDVYVIDMSSFNKESNACFFAKASPSINWLWHKRLSHLNFKNINNLAKHNLVSGLPSLTFSKDKNCSACEKGKHHRASFKTKRSFSINKSLHLLHMDLFGPVKPQTISHNKYTLVILDEYSRKMENLNEVRVKELRT
ncbi:retrovirus-related pol polyprotein from transposon TNT 1-94 [Tanacetum coccineum]|uniref:Retrovirus-related pol polyprotein from transposon TNT 1-94 n=1 Tax=Tanacetum coccineum TaxID=301880 RepID=A0ABQ4XAY9_9ASTR